MRGRIRLIAALALAALCAPGTWLRTDVPNTAPDEVTLTKVAGPSATDVLGWSVGGVWSYTATSRYFGGFSALIALSGNHLRAFSDRGARFTFLEPDLPDPHPLDVPVVYQRPQAGYENQLWDIEAATRDPVSGDYWLAYENFHAIHRFTVASEPDGVRELDGEVDWYMNGGAEAFARLSDGRFLIVVEGRAEGLLYPSDPVEGAEAQVFAVQSPEEGFVVTDLAQLPDGRLIMLMRDVVQGVPPFSCFLAIADPPTGEPGEVWQPEKLLDLDAVIPRENYEGLAVRPLEDGTVAVWLIADDNFSVLQRNLLAKLVFDPAVAEP